MKNPLLAPELREMLASKDAQFLTDFCESMHPVLAAEFLSALTAEEAWAVLQYAPPRLRAEIFSNMENDVQAEAISTLSRGDVARLFADIPHDERADLFKRLPEEEQEAILPALAQAEREDIRRLAAYEEGTAGAVMTSDYAALDPHMSASQAIEHLRTVAPDRETIYYAYVLDDHRRLVGFVSLKDLILARRDAEIEAIMHRDVICAGAEDDQEEAARKIQKYDLLALPIVDGSGALVGIVTHDDALDIITQEHTEDLEKLMAIGGRHGAMAYIETPVWAHFRNRCPWVIALAGLGLVSGYIVQSFEDLLMRFAVLAAFMPMLADTGGNTGSQSATLVIRALALGEISPKNLLQIVAKEFRVALLLALLLGIIAFARVVLLGGGSMLPGGYSLVRVAMAIALALGLQVITSTVIGALLPLAAAKAKWDPAVVASPALTTIVDITGLLIYFTTAKFLLFS